MELEDDLIHALNRSLLVSGSTTTENNVARKAINKENFTRHLVVKLQRMHEPKPTEVQFDTEGVCNAWNIFVKTILST